MNGATEKSGKKVAILQSNYIPWKGYFDIIASVDEFILYDDVQFTKNDWRNRNKIKAPSGTHWLTIPVYHSIDDKISDVKISQTNWNDKHWKTIRQNYAKAGAFNEVKDFVGDLYASASQSHISEINRVFIQAICRFLDIDTLITRASDYTYGGDKSMRVLSLCKAAGGSAYVSGPAAQDYLDTELFRRENIEILWADYSGYPEYPQVHAPFDHGVSILDLILNTGTAAANFMKYVRPSSK